MYTGECTAAGFDVHRLSAGLRLHVKPGGVDTQSERAHEPGQGPLVHVVYTGELSQNEVENRAPSRYL